jgi:hypothetical protein
MEYRPRNPDGHREASVNELKPAVLCTADRRAFSLGWENDVTDELDSTIKQNAEGPESASADGVSVKQHSLRDQIEADKYLASKQAARNPVKAFTRAKIVAPGTV